MGPLVLAVLVYLFGIALAAAVPLATPAFPPRQILPIPSPPPPSGGFSALAPPVGVVPNNGPPLHTILGIPTATFVILSSTTTSFVPSSTTTRTFTFTPTPHTVITTSRTTVVEETIQTVVRPDPTDSNLAAAASSSPPAADTGASPNGSVGVWSLDTRGSSAVRLGGVLLGVFLAVQPW